MNLHKGVKSKQFLDEIDNFKSKWNLSTYFYLRNNVKTFSNFIFFAYIYYEKKEIVKNFEKNFKNLLQVNLEKIEKGMGTIIKDTHPLATFLCDMINNCFRKGIFIKALLEHFFRLSLQIISRFCNLLELNIKGLATDESNLYNQEKMCFIANDLNQVLEILFTEKNSFEENLVIYFF